MSAKIRPAELNSESATASKGKCENCGDMCEQDGMIATPECQWICTSCFAEDPEFYGFDLDLDGDGVTDEQYRAECRKVRG